MRETLEELRKKDIGLVNVVYIPDCENDETSDYWRRGHYAVEQIMTKGSHFIAIPRDCLNSLLGKTLTSSVMRCSKKALESASKDNGCKVCNVVFDSNAESVEIFFESGAKVVIF